MRSFSLHLRRRSTKKIGDPSFILGPINDDEVVISESVTNPLPYHLLELLKKYNLILETPWFARAT